MIKLIDILKEGAYDSMTRNIVTDIIRDWKDQYMEEQGELEFEEDYEMTNTQTTEHNKTIHLTDELEAFLRSKKLLICLIGQKKDQSFCLK